jgi:hypothetical protein
MRFCDGSRTVAAVRVSYLWRALLKAVEGAGSPFPVMRMAGGCDVLLLFLVALDQKSACKLQPCARSRFCLRPQA